MLFDRKSDPHEQHNLAGTAAAADTERELRLRVLEHFVQTSGADQTTQ